MIVAELHICQPLLGWDLKNIAELNFLRHLRKRGLPVSDEPRPVCSVNGFHLILPLPRPS
jgi:hypothetical protein